MNESATTPAPVPTPAYQAPAAVATADAGGKTQHYDPVATKQAARGHWVDIFAHLAGVDPSILDGRHGPCPRCGGTDRFRAFDDVADTGGLYCNQCHANRNGDGFSALEWLQGWDFRGAVRKVAEYLGIEPSRNGHGKLNGKARKTPLLDAVEWSPLSDIHLASLGPAWCATKPPITIAALKAADVKFCMWPRGSSGHRCLALFGRRIDGEASEPTALVLYNLDAREFPAFGKLAARKTHLVKGSVEGWIWAGNVETLKSAKVIVKVEGPSDFLAVLSIGLPSGWIVITNSCGAKSANSKKLDFSWAAGKLVIVVGDADVPGQEGARRFAAAFHQAGASEVRMVALPYEVTPDHGKDLRDWLNEGHNAGDFLRLVETTEAVTAEDFRTARPEILTGVDESRVVNEAIAALAQRDDVFQRGGMLVEVVRGGKPPAGIARPKDAPRIAPIRPPRLRELLASSADWMKPCGESDSQPTHPPAWTVAAVDARGQWQDIRGVEGVVEAPALRADGSVLQRPGYDPETGLLFEPQHTFPEIPAKPSRADAERARDALLDVVVDFPFATDAHRAAWVASVLTPIARYAYYGPAPLFLVDGNIRGCGKGLLIDVTGQIVSGRSMARMTAPKDDDEFRKRITALAVCGESIVLIDNLSGMLGSPSLDAALTATSWSDRVLGRTEMVTLPLLATWYATGNNIIVVADTARRICHVRLESSEETPEERSGFQHPDLLAWVRENRPRLATAAVTILAAYCAAGRPDMRLTPWGSFEGWSGLVRQAVVWAGMPDPATTRRELTTQADQDAMTLRMILDGLSEMDPLGRGLTVATILKRLTDFPGEYQGLRTAILESIPSKDGRLPTTRSMGQKLRHLRKRVMGGRFLDSRDSNQGAVWSVKGALKSDSRDKSDSSSSPSLFNGKSQREEDKKINIEGAETTVTLVSTVTPCPHCKAADPVETPAADGRIAVNCRQCGHFFGWKD